MTITIVLSYEIGESCSHLCIPDTQSKVNYTVNKEAQKPYAGICLGKSLKKPPR
jgi:hypothetical protein